MFVEHLYIHIPFCNSICKYCDFVRFVSNEQTKHKYIQKIVKQINTIKNKMKSIYIGGGTPNSLSNKDLELLLSSLNKLVITNVTEFTIECNPEFINEEQCKIFKKFKVNRVSMGVQTCNQKLLKQIGRKHTVKDVLNSIKLLRKHKINNISCDFIYGFHDQTLEDIKTSLKFIIKNKIPHCSFYSLEIKDNSIFSKENYKINDNEIDEQLDYINNNFSYKRYEVSNWVLSSKYESIHNKAYWTFKNWNAIGLSASGHIDRKIYTNVGNLNIWKKEFLMLTKEQYYQQIIILGLRLLKGINLKNKTNMSAYKYYKNRLRNVFVKNNRLICKDVNILNYSIEQII